MIQKLDFKFQRLSHHVDVQTNDVRRCLDNLEHMEELSHNIKEQQLKISTANVELGRDKADEKEF